MTIPAASLLVALLAAFIPPEPIAAAGRPAPLQPVKARVIKVFDGDTLLVDLLGKEQSVRLLGVDCPEVSHPTHPLEFLAREGADFVRGLAAGETVTLEADSIADERDKYDRLLRYVTLPDGRLLNALLIEEGYCYALTRFPLSMREAFTSLEQQARLKGVRLWDGGGLAELRWLEETGGGSFAVYPMTRQTWGVRYGNRVRLRLSARQLQSTLASVVRWSAELGPAELDARLEREGWARSTR